MEAAGAGCAGVERGRPLGLPWGWCPPACRGAAPLGVGPSAYCPGERAIVGTWSAALIGSREISVWGSAHQPTAWPENLFCKGTSYNNFLNTLKSACDSSLSENLDILNI
nr:E3 ubiquitin-protein ligase RNF4 isoform X2 [Rattus norvegicus]